MLTKLSSPAGHQWHVCSIGPPHSAEHRHYYKYWQQYQESVRQTATNKLIPTSATMGEQLLFAKVMDALVALGNVEAIAMSMAVHAFELDKDRYYQVVGYKWDANDEQSFKWDHHTHSGVP